MTRNTPLTPGEAEEARAEIRAVLERMRGDAADQVARAQQALDDLDAAIGRFHSAGVLGEDLGWRVYCAAGSARRLTKPGSLEGEATRRTEDLVGRYLRGIGNTYLVV